MPQDPEQKLSGTLSLLLVSEETPQGEGQKEGLRGVPPGRGGPEEADHKRAVAVCWALGTCSPDGAWRKVMSVSDIHSQELLGLPVSLPRSNSPKVLAILKELRAGVLHRAGVESSGGGTVPRAVRQVPDPCAFYKELSQ